MRKIQIIPLAKREILRKYFYDYLTELSEFDPEVYFDEKGVPIYQWFDCYWEDKDRFPIFFFVDEKIAGLAMIRELDVLRYDFAEFYVCPEQRKDGNAIWFASEIANLFDGEFTFSTRFTNPRAIKFWGKFAQMFDSVESFDDEIRRNWVIRKNNNKTHTLNLNPIYFDLINSEEKTLEGRLNDEKRQQFNVGDKIIFYKEPEKIETVTVVILDKYIFKDFDEMAENLNKSDLGFKTKSKAEMIETYREIYSKEKEDKFGVVIFKIQQCK